MAHHNLMWELLKDFTKGAAADALRAQMGKAIGTHTPVEARDLKPLVIGVMAKWHKLQIREGMWTHRAVHAYRENLVRYALGISDLTHVPTVHLSTKAPLDPAEWAFTYARLVDEAEVQAGRPSPQVGQAPAPAPRRVQQGSPDPAAQVAGPDYAREQEEVVQPPGKMRKVEGGAGSRGAAVSSKEAKGDKRAEERESQRKDASRVPRIKVEPGETKVHFLCFPKHYSPQP